MPQLRKALNNAGAVEIEGYEITDYTLAQTMRVGYDDEIVWEFNDQEIDIKDGQATALTLDKEEVTITFSKMVTMTNEDLS